MEVERDGWVLVPKVATREMLSAAAFATSGITTGKWNDMAAAAYVAMISVAPAAPKSPTLTDLLGDPRKSVECFTQGFEPKK